METAIAAARLASGPTLIGTATLRFADAQPCAGSHASVVQESLSLQFGAVPALQAPAWQVSPPLHWLPSLHEAPSALLVNVQPLDGLHESLVHGFTSLHVSGVPAAQAPP